jgi:hypothetical protein
MNKRAILILSIVAIGLIWSGANTQTNIVTNGDFEGGFTPDGTGDLIPNGWTKLETSPGENSTLN